MSISKQVHVFVLYGAAAQRDQPDADSHGPVATKPLHMKLCQHIVRTGQGMPLAFTAGCCQVA
jgi:hypothetical protein